MLDESNSHFRGVGSVSSPCLLLMEIMLANNVDPDQTPHCMASDLVLSALFAEDPFYGFPGQNGFNFIGSTSWFQQIKLQTTVLLFDGCTTLL